MRDFVRGLPASAAPKIRPRGESPKGLTPRGSFRFRIGLGALRRRVPHRAGDLRKDLADVLGNARHDRAGGNGDKAGHQCVFDQVLSLGVFPDPELDQEVVDAVHLQIPLVSCSCLAVACYEKDIGSLVKFN